MKIKKCRKQTFEYGRLLSWCELIGEGPNTVSANDWTGASLSGPRSLLDGNWLFVTLLFETFFNPSEETTYLKDQKK